MNGQPTIQNFKAADGHRLNVHVWSAQTSPRARVVFVHGITSHAGWYSRGNEWLAAAGVEVHFLDRRGSGVDQGARGDIDEWRTWIDDVAVYLRQLRSIHATPPFLCGISWGGKLAVAVTRCHAELVAGLGLICPGLYSPFEPGLIKRLVLRLPVPTGVQGRRLAIPLREPALFTQSPKWQEFIRDDPLTLREITWRFAREDRMLTRFAREAGPLLTLPLLLMLGRRDRIIDNKQVREFYERAASPAKTLFEYPHAAHTLEFEPDPQPYWNDLARWLCDAGSSLRAGQRGDDLRKAPRHAAGHD